MPTKDRKTYMAAYRAEHLEEERARQAARYAADPEKFKAHNIAYYAANAEKARAYSRAWKAAHRSTGVLDIRPHIVYRFFGFEGLLYVGFTSDTKPRRVHRKKFWWPKVLSTTVVQYDNRAEAKAAETAAIKSEQPVYNIHENEALTATPNRH